MLDFSEGSVVDGSQFADFGGGVFGVDGGQFQVLRAEYGAGNRWTDVTPRFRDLTRTDRQFRVENDAFRVDPAPGIGKILRVEARDPRGVARVFEFREGSLVDGAQFSNGFQGGGTVFQPIPAPINQLAIVSAVYGAGNRSVDVSARVRSLVRDGRLNFTVNNFSMAIDPAPGIHKSLSVTFSIGGGPQRRAVVGEGDQINLP
jgi:hypothetical protein